MSWDNLCENVATDKATGDTLFEQLATVQAYLSQK